MPRLHLGSVQPPGHPEALEGRREGPGVRGLLGQPRLDRTVRVLSGPEYERGHFLDPPVPEGQDVERKREIALLLRVPAVERQRLLTTGPRPDGTPVPVARQRREPQELGDVLMTVEPR